MVLIVTGIALGTLAALSGVVHEKLAAAFLLMTGAVWLQATERRVSANRGQPFSGLDCANVQATDQRANPLLTSSTAGRRQFVGLV